MSMTPDPRQQGYQQPMNQEPVYEGQPYGVDNNTVQSSNVGGAYSQTRHENYVDPQGNRVENRVEVYEDKNQSRANTRYWIKAVTYFVLAVLEIILLLYLFFGLFGANKGNGFIAFLYSLSHVFVAPFNGIFPNGGFAVSTIIAMIVYALIAWGIVSLGRVIFAPVVSGRQSITTTRRDRSL